ncbi:MAG: EAL domain-containing protein [Magnetococcales bacterium]|nr:EAL domain-containing protein [Magnetococcales bacterium]
MRHKSDPFSHALNDRTIITDSDLYSDIKEYESIIEQEENDTLGRYRDLRLSSAFQPIFSPSHCRVIGYEGLVRGHDLQGKPVSPKNIFNKSDDPLESLYLDRLTRLLHVLNFIQKDPGEGLLFLNLSPDVILHSRQMNFAAYTKSLVERFGLEPERVVIEILESAIPDETALMEVIKHYRDVGFQIAVDDFGAGESNIDRLWKLSPDIIKLDRSLIFNARHNAQAKRLLPGLVNLMHQFGGLVLLEGVETEEEAKIALDADVDLVQGFIFAKPQPQLLDVTVKKDFFQDLSQQIFEEENHLSQHHIGWLATHAGQFWEGVEKLQGEEYPTYLFNHPNMLRWYVLDEKGWQLGESLQNNQTQSPLAETKHNPLLQGKDSDWSRRPYYRRAVRYPGEVQVTGPYFSIPDATFCITFSIARAANDGETRIYCCDFKWQELEGGHSFLISGSMGPWKRPKQNGNKP